VSHELVAHGSQLIAYMIIDILLLILLIFAVFKGLRNGFVIAVFSFLAIIIGLAAAMKLSTWVADWLKDSTSISAGWLPFVAFALVMIGVVLLVRLGALAIHSALKMAMLGWLNKLAGIILYAVLFITVYSIVLFYARQIQLLKAETFAASQTYPFIQPWGPKAIDLFASVIPWFKGMFEELSGFFGSLPSRVK
jgi:membrane protein required for colicin V production